MFERTTRAVALTPAGEAFAEDARAALSMVDSAARKARAAGRGEAGELVIGMVGSAVQHPLPTITQVEQLRASALELVPVLREPLVAVLPSDHRLAGRRRIAVSTLAREPFALFPRALGPGLYDEITALCLRGGFAPVVAQEAVQLPTIVGLVAADCGVSVLPNSAAVLRPKVAFVPVSPLVRLVGLAIALPVKRSVAAANFTALARELSPARHSTMD